MVRFRLAVTLVGFLLGYSPYAAEAQEAVPAPAYKEGDSWVFRVSGGSLSDGEHVIAYKNGAFESSSASFLESPLFPTINIDDPQKKWFQFPLAAGKKWSFRYPRTNIRTGRFEWRDSDAQVIGPAPQPIETPAGKFNAIEIRRADSGGTWYTLVYFYSPETKSVVKLVVDIDRPPSHFEMELIKHSVR